MARKNKSPLPEQSDEEKSRIRQLEKWKHRVAVSKRVRDDWETEQQVLECEKYFLGEQGEYSTRRRNSRSFNHFRAIVRTQKPNLFHSNPKFFVRPKKGTDGPETELKAAQGEGVLDAIGTQDDNLQNAASLGLHQAFFRVGVLKVCYDPSLEPNPRAGEPIYVIDPMTGREMKDDLGNAIPMKNALTGKVTVEPDMVMPDETYRYEWVDAKNMLFPDEGPDRSKWPWIGEEVTIALDDAKEDERFPKELREMFQSNTQTGRDGQRQKRKDVPHGDELFKYIELYDKRTKRQLIYAEGQIFDDFLVDQPLPPGIEDDPYAILSLGDPIMSPEPSAWPCPATKSWLPIQDSYNILRKMSDEGAKRSARKLMYDESTFAGPEEMAKFASTDDMVGVKINDITRPPLPMIDPPLSQDIYRNIDLALMDYRIVSGQTGARMGATEDTSATEATFVERSANLRNTNDQDTVNMWLSVAGRKMFQLVKSTLTLDMWIKLRDFRAEEILPVLAKMHHVDPMMLGTMLDMMPEAKRLIIEMYGKERWAQVTREELTFEADVTVVPGSARPVNLDAERRSFMEFLQLIGQAPQLLLSMELVDYAAKMFDPPIPKNVVMSLNQLAMAMMGAQQQTAGHGSDKGGDNPGAGTGSTAGNPDKPAQVQGVQNAIAA